MLSQHPLVRFCPTLTLTLFNSPQIMTDEGHEDYSAGRPLVPVTREVVKAAVEKNGNALRRAPDELKEDPQIVLAAIRQNGAAFLHASGSLRANRSFVLEAVAIDATCLEFAHERLRADPAVVLAAVSENGYSLEYAPLSLREDRGFMMEALQRNGMLLHWAPAYMLGDRQVRAGFVGLLAALAKHLGASPPVYSHSNRCLH